MAILPKEPQIDRLALRAAQMIAKVSHLARDSQGEAASQNELAVLQITTMMTRETAELIGSELGAAKKGR